MTFFVGAVNGNMKDVMDSAVLTIADSVSLVTSRSMNPADAGEGKKKKKRGIGKNKKDSLLSKFNLE